MTEKKEKKNRKLIWIFLLFLIVSGIVVFINRDRLFPENEPAVIKPLTSIEKKEVTINAGDEYDPKSNLIVGENDIIYVDTDLNTTKAGRYEVHIEVTSPTGEKDNLSYVVIVNEPQSENGCSLVYVVDEEAWQEQVWKIDKPAQQAVTEQKYVKDSDAVAEQYHYEEVWIEEQGHYEQILIKEAVAETGHYETVHHDAVTHEEAVYEDIRYWHYDFSDGYSCVYTDDQMRSMGYGNGDDFVDAYCNEHSCTCHWWSTTDKVQIGSVTIIDKEAYDEQVYVIDTLGEDAVYEQKWVIDKEGHYEKQKVIDVPAQAEQGHYETVVIKEAVPEEGHWETVIHPEKGHYEEKGC
ncbi:MAG: hypothetical protein IKE77_06825 [Erysipelotrichaceae bacterium]|nr:hypothetical protein [Erysipelotrichaceae bacterium]